MLIISTFKRGVYDLEKRTPQTTPFPSSALPRIFGTNRGASHFPTPLKNFAYFFATPCIFESLQLYAFATPLRLHATPCPSRSPLFVTGSDTLQKIYMCIMNRILHVIENFQALTSFRKYIFIFHAFLATLCICDSMRLHDFF